jgi:hypothetical protein
MRLAVLLLLCVLPQLGGWLAYRQIAQRQKLVAHLLGLLTPPLVFFYWARWLAEPTPEQIKAMGGCGMPLMAISMLILLGTAMQLLVAAIIQLYAEAKAKKVLKELHLVQEVIL